MMNLGMFIFKDSLFGFLPNRPCDQDLGASILIWGAMLGRKLERLGKLRQSRMKAMGRKMHS